MASYKDVIEGLQILAKYEPEGQEASAIVAEDGVIYSGPSDTDLVSADDKARLEALGWQIEEHKPFGLGVCRIWAKKAY